jgi:hypothetical protein
MSVVSSAVNVAATATLLAKADGDGDEIVVTNVGTEIVYVGAAAVATTDGFPVASGGALSFKLSAGSSVYGIVAAGTEPVRVFKESS